MNSLEKSFLKKPSKEKAKEIIKKYSNYVGMGKGLNIFSSTKYAREKISLFGEYIKGELSEKEIKDYLKEEESKVIGKIATDYLGFSNLSLEKIVLNIMKEDFKEDLSGKKFFLIFKKKGNKIIIDYKQIPKEYEKKRIERIEKYEKYLNLIKEK